MIEILVLIWLSLSIAAKARKEGRDGKPYVILLLVLWFGGEFFGAVSMVLLAKDLWAVYLGALSGAVAGAALAFVIVGSLWLWRTRDERRLLSESQLAVLPDAPPKGNDPRLRDGPVEGPPEEDAWERYNKRLEFPLATVAAVLAHVVVGVVLLFGILQLMAGDDSSGPKLELVAVGGMDDAGEGSAGSGGNPDPDLIRDVSPMNSTKSVIPVTAALEQAKENIQKIVLEDPSGKIPIAASNAAAYSQLDDNLRKKLLGVGSQKGEGNQPGKGFDGTPGAGPGGTGADSTRARGLRWVLRFKVANGRDYLEQLKAMNAELLFPIPGSDKSILITNLGNPNGKVATDADLRGLAGKIQFSDTRRDAVQGVAGAVGLDFTPKTFFAFFPKGLENDLARLETSYRNRRAEDIEETVFRVTIRGDKFEFVVDEQQIKK